MSNVKDILRIYGVEKPTEEILVKRENKKIKQEPSLTREELHKINLLKIEEDGKKFREAQEEQKRIDEENKLIEELNNVQNKLTNPFSLGRKVDTNKIRQATIDNVLPKSFVPEQITSYPEPFEEEPALNRELAEFKKQINGHLSKLGFASGAGGGAGIMGDLDDVDISSRTHKSILMFNDVTSKYEVADPDLDAGISNEDDTGDEIILNATATGGADEGGSIQQENETRMAISDTTVSSLSLSTATLTLTDSASTEVTVDLSGLVSDNITTSANNSTNETVYPVFVDGATGTQGLETDTGLNYNPSTGLLTSTGFSGNLTGTLQTAAQGNVTSLGTLTTLTIDNVIINGTTIGHTSDIDLMTVADGELTVTGTVSVSANIKPVNAGGSDLGGTSKEFNDLYLNDSGTILWGNDQEIRLRHLADQGLEIQSTHDAPLVRRGEDVFIVLDQTAAAGTDAGDNVIMDRSAADGTDAVDDIIGEDEVFLHSGMQRNVINIRGSSGEILNSVAGFAPGAI